MAGINRIDTVCPHFLPWLQTSKGEINDVCKIGRHICACDTWNCPVKKTGEYKGA